MAKYCSKCNKKLGLFERLNEGGICDECYEINIQEQKELEEKKIQEQRELEEKRKYELKIKEEKLYKEKMDIVRDYLLYTNHYWVVIGNISLIPFHYDDIFNKSITNKFEIIKLLLDEIIKELPKDFSFNDIKKITTYRKSSIIIEKALKPYVRINLNSEKYCLQQVELQKYSNNPNPRILDDVEENSYFLCNSYIINFDILANKFIENQIELINAIQKNINDMKKCRENPKYDYAMCMADIEEYELDQVYAILYIYYFYATLIVYYIYFNKTIDIIINNSELYNIYIKLKNEIHNENYIVQKLYPIYNSLYKDEYDITFNDEDEFKLLIETINDKEKVMEKDDFIDINSSVLDINVNKFMNCLDDEELGFKVIDEINSNIVSYKKYLSINDVLDILIYSRKFMDIINEVKKQQALKEKDRILNGLFEEEKQMNNDLLDYSNITNGYDFEAYVANLYSLLGYKVLDLTSKSGDQGADVIIEKDNIKYAVQVKYYNNPVGNKAVQEVVAAKSYYKTDRAMVVTNSTFTPQAITLANANDVLLVDGNELDELIKKAKIK